MSSRFASLAARPPAAQTQEPAAATPAPAANPAPAPVARARVPAARESKVPVIGYFTPNLRQELKLMAVQERSSVQALLGEAIDLLMRHRGKHPFSER